ncbi:MAG TPA: PilZ domain-containing protein [Terriglobales bacterium]|nr:PilZ domain-containing protein [Terriglobales bacterium]
MTSPERRRHVRYSCEVPVEVRAAGEVEVCQGLLADICLGGCYVSLLAPLPAGTSVQLSFAIAESATILTGRTVTSLPGSGMGIEFTGMADEASTLRLLQLIRYLETDVESDSALSS